MTVSPETSDTTGVLPARPSIQPKTADLTVVIPALNEQENLEILLPLLRETIQDMGLQYEVVVVDGGSHDGSRMVSEQLGARVVSQQERGYGGALLAGFAAANTPYIVTMDADLSHQPMFLKDFWKQRSEAELLVASRYVPGGRAEMGRGRRMLSILLNRTFRRVLDLPLHDVSSGFRMYDRRVLATLELKARDFDALEEILVRIYIGGGRVREVPFHYQVRNSGKSHAKLIKFGWAFSKTLFRMWRLRHSK
jgi:dolichol-phosphate mannosyltransferase